MLLPIYIYICSFLHLIWALIRNYSEFLSLKEDRGNILVRKTAQILWALAPIFTQRQKYIRIKKLILKNTT